MAKSQALLTPALIILAALPLTGCTVLFNRPHGSEVEFMTTKEFRGYTESVFRRHNRVQSDLMMLLPEIEEAKPETHRRLLKAEAPMLKACEPLNEVVARYIDGGDVNFFRRLKLTLDVTDCDRQTRRVEKLLDLEMGVI